MSQDRWLFRMVLLAALLAWGIVMLGAYTRLKDAGLGCPDWPGCYGHLAPSSIPSAKAWIEMIHRYLAGCLGLLVVGILGRVLFTQRRYHTGRILPLIIAVVVILQASLGRWTVTLKLLPPIVMLHLLGGMALTVLLALFALRLRSRFSGVLAVGQRRFGYFAILGLVLLILQVILGGWTSTHYAALVCPSFPYCDGQSLPPLHFEHAFKLFDTIGLNYEGGVLDDAARITIQFTHRIGAAVVLAYWLLLAIAMLGLAKSPLLFRFAVLMLLLLILQIVLGVLNVMWQLPAAIAVAHNGVATLLLFSSAALINSLYRQDAA